MSVGLNFWRCCPTLGGKAGQSSITMGCSAHKPELSPGELLNGRKAGGDLSNVESSRNAVKPNSSVRSARPTNEKAGGREG